MSLRALRRLAIALAVIAAAGGCRARLDKPAAEAAPKALYHCPMHPTYTSDRPGTCPICGMSLVRVEHGAEHGATADPTAVAGRALVVMPPERRQLLGVRSAPVERRRLVRTIRTVGRVAVDERRVHHVHTKFEGYVEHLYVDFTGKRVSRGDRLLSFYSPELVASQQEYLLAYRAQQKLAASGIPSVAQGGADLLEAARQRLLLWDVRPEDIAALERNGRVERTLDLYAEQGGYVVQKMAVHGMRITPADSLFDIADLSHLWVLADVYESDLPLVRPGMSATLSVPFLPARRWRGPVTYIDPMVAETTRTVKVRVEVDNAGEALKPDMFADVTLESDLGMGLRLPESAVIHTGDREIVFVDHGDGRFEPRAVQLGPRVGDGFQVLTGVTEGEQVAASANFLLDSESSLRAAVASMAPQATPSPAHVH
jgi:Cu(I)/Ag(I) efflux system membrane fusion protein